MQLLLIKINTLESNPEYALLGKKQKEDRFIPGDWKRIKSLIRSRRVVLLIPNSEVVLTSVNIPSKNKKQLLQAVPFSLEDTLAEDIDDLHFAIHQTNNDKHLTNVAVISRACIDSYQNLFRQHGLKAHFLLPELFSRATTKNSWSIYQTDNTVTVRLDDFSGFHCDSELLDIFTEPLEKPECILSNIPKEQLPKGLQDCSYESINTTRIRYSDVISALPLNLLTGFISEKNGSSFNWKAWRPSLIIGSFLVATWLGTLVWQNNLLKKQQKQLKTSIEKTFTTAFPKSRLVDPAQQMTSNLRQLKKKTGKAINSPLPLISSISPILKSYKEISLSEIRYQEDEVTLVVQLPSLTHLENFKKEIAKKANLQIKIKSSTTTANTVEAILIISPQKLSSLTKSLTKSSTKFSKTTLTKTLTIERQA